MTAPAGRRGAWGALALLLPLLVVAVYWPGLGGGFAFDDYPNIVENRGLHVVPGADWNQWVAAVFSSPASDLQRPLAMFTFAVNHWFTGLAPMPMKATNLAVHCLNSLLVFGLVRRLLRAVPWSGATPLGGARPDAVALFASACWALHPINLMAVLLIVQRMEALSHTFVFAGLWLYVVGHQRQVDGLPGGWSRLLAGLVLGTALGTLAKESSVLLPLYALCLELFVFGFRGHAGAPDRRLHGVFLATLVLPGVVGAAWLLDRYLAPGAWAGFDYGMAERLLTEPRVVLDYLRWIVVPDLGQLSLHHDDYTVSRGLWSPPATAFALVAIAALAAGAWALRRRRPLLALGLAWFLGAHLLTATFVPLDLVYEHRNYFAALGVCLALADLLLVAPARAGAVRIGGLLAALLLVFFAAITHLRARDWDHPVRFSISEAAKHPDSPRATYDLARTLVVLGGYDPASPFTREAWPALERARAAPNAGVLPVTATLQLAARTGRPLEAQWWRELQAHLRDDPHSSQHNSALASLAGCAIQRLCAFPPDDMVATFAAALAERPRPEVLNVFANYVLNVMHEPALALQLWQEAAELNPRQPQYRISQAQLLVAMGRLDEARAQVAHLRRMGRMGQNEAAAREIEARIRRFEATHPQAR